MPVPNPLAFMLDLTFAIIVVSIQECMCEIPHRLERGTSVSENAGPGKGVDCEIPHRLETGTNYCL